MSSEWSLEWAPADSKSTWREALIRGRREDYVPQGLARERRDGYLIGTRRFSSSPQCCTTIICGGGEAWSVPPPSLIMRNRWPSGEMSYVRPVLPPGIVK